MKAKAMLLSFVAIVVCAMTPLFAEAPGSAGSQLRRSVRVALEDLSKQYVAARPGRTVRDGLTLVAVKNQSRAAETGRIGEAVSVFFAEEIAKSTVFFLVERENLGKLLDEMELSMSGLVTGVSDFKGLSAVDVMAAGSVVEAGADFHVDLRLVDAATGATLAVASFELPKHVLAKASEELQYSYVAANGIGLSFGSLYLPFPTPFFKNNYVHLLFDLGAAYRPERRWMFGAGAMLPFSDQSDDYSYEQYGEGTYSYPTMQPGLLPGGNGALGFEAFGGNSSKSPMQDSYFEYSILHLDAQYTVNFSPAFNIGVSGSVMTYIQTPRMTLSIGKHALGGLYYRQQFFNGTDYDYLPAIDNTPIVYQFDSTRFAGLRGELRPEIFITPRLALTMKIGYLWTPPLSVTGVKAGYAAWDFRESEGVDHATWVPADEAASPIDTPPQLPWDPDHPREQDNNQSSWIYYGWNPFMSPDSGRWAFDLSGLYAGVFVSVFF